MSTSIGAVNLDYDMVWTDDNSETLTRTVRFRAEVDGGAVQFSMPAPMDGLQVGTHLYSGKIYLQVAA